MNLHYERLFSPIQINSMLLKNRIMFPCMATNFNHTTGETSDEYIGFFTRLARGGAGMLITDNMFPMSLRHRPTLANLALHQKAAVVARDAIDLRERISRTNWAPLEPIPSLNPRLFDLIEAVHVNGSKLCASLSPNPVGWILDNYDINDKKHQGIELFAKMPVAEIEEVIETFATVAGEVKNIGFDAIEIHMSYLANFFAHAAFNKRTDKYSGASWDTRLLFLEELIKNTRAEVGPDYPLLLIITADHFGAKGWRTIEETKVIVQKLEEWGIDAIRTRGGGGVKGQYDIAPMYMPSGLTVHLAAALKEVISIPVIASSRLSNPDLAERVLQEGKADMISIGRGLIADPDLPKKAMAGQANRVRKCIACNIGCLGNLLSLPRLSSRCTVNPMFGHEYRLPERVEPAAESKKVVIVGAGPGGMSAALTACQRGHQVTLIEKTGELGGGGHFKQCTIPPFKERILNIPGHYRREFAELDNLQLHLNTEADADSVMQLAPDAVIIATGGGALIPEIPGADAPQVITYEDVLLSRSAVGDNVVIIGGGCVGCETALYLLDRKKRVTILEKLYRIANDVELETRNCLMELLPEQGCEMVTNARIVSISGGTVNYELGGRELSVQGDTVVLALGGKSEDRLYRDLLPLAINLQVIGDASKPRQIIHAISEGFFAAHNL